jgi:hypothetical protein
MVALLIILGLAVLLLLLSMLTAHAVLEYRENVNLTLSVLFFKFRLFPAKKKKVRISNHSKKSARKRKRKTEKKPKSESSPQKPTEEKGILEKLDGLKKLLSALLKNTFGHLKIRTSRIRIHVAAGDAASTAVLYGAVNSALVFILEMLDRFGKLNSKKQDVIEVAPDFISEKTTVDIRIDFSLRVWQIIDIALKTFVSYIRSKNKNTK